MVLLPVARPEPRSPVSPKNYANVIDAIGFGPAQILTCAVSGAVWAADGAELLILGSVTRAVAEEWKLQAWQRGAVVSVVFIGILLGNTSSGPIGDGVGRKLPVLASFVGIVVFSVLSASATGFIMLAAIRMFVGASFGIGQPAILTLLNDITPSRWRVLVVSQGQGLFCLGEIYAASLIWWNDPSMQALDWRWLCIMGAIPSITGFVLAYFFLKESPGYLLENGHHEEAQAVLESFKSWNGADHVCCESVTASSQARTPRSARQNVEAIFSWSLILTTLAMMYSCFMLNCAFYGTLYSFPQVLTDVKTPYAPAVALIVGAMSEWPAFFVAPALEQVVDKKVILRVYPVVAASVLLMFIIGANGNGLLYSVLLQAGYLGVKMILGIGFVVVYACACTAFPVAVRTTGTAACIAGGRVGGILAPLIFEQLMESFGSWEAFFFFLTGGYILNALIVFALKLEDSEDLEGLEEALPVRSLAAKSFGSA
mmetsp:Transcript_105760/g.252274  ORF Transcript_105760/g.252274 Transcript_105760/m.252274 type:complete len:485 (+) Transcript_105760:102-1556(+)